MNEDFVYLMDFCVTKLIPEDIKWSIDGILKIRLSGLHIFNKIVLHFRIDFHGIKITVIPQISNINYLKNINNFS